MPGQCSRTADTERGREEDEEEEENESTRVDKPSSDNHELEGDEPPRKIMVAFRAGGSVELQALR